MPREDGNREQRPLAQDGAERQGEVAQPLETGLPGEAPADVAGSRCLLGLREAVVLEDDETETMRR